MSILISLLITFLVIILVLYLVNMLPIDGRAKQIVRVIVIIIGVLSLLKYLDRLLDPASPPCAASRATSSFRPTACLPTAKARCRRRSRTTPISIFSRRASTTPRPSSTAAIRMKAARAPALRKRLVLTRQIAAIAPDTTYPNALLLESDWARHSIRPCSELGVTDGTIAIIGGPGRVQHVPAALRRLSSVPRRDRRAFPAAFRRSPKPGRTRRRRTCWRGTVSSPARGAISTPRPASRW